MAREQFTITVPRDVGDFLQRAKPVGMNWADWILDLFGYERVVTHSEIRPKGCKTE